MSIKKYTLLTLLLSLGLSGVFAQLAGGIDYMDSSKYSAKKMAQYNEWANGLASSPFPPKPRDAWQIGVFGGVGSIAGDVTATGWNAGISARKSIGYVVSVRPGISYSKITGLGYENQFSTANLPEAVRNKYENPQTGSQTGKQTSFVPYFQTDLITPSLDFLVSLNNIMFHKKQSNWNYYVLVGYSPMSYKTNLEALDGQTAYNFANGGIDYTQKRNDIKDQLEGLLGDDFETPAITRNRRQNFNEGGQGQRQWRHSVNVGAGFERRLGDIVSISGEFKYTLSGDDYIDGIAYAAPGLHTSAKDAVMFANLGFNFNLGLKSRKKFLQQSGKDEPNTDLGQFPGKNVAPLWMENPLVQPYGELANPTRMNMPKGWLEDSDTDGVLDQFDLEPNTPAGAPVDSRGRTRDTDGDGVPDYLDKELITPTACQPVNADGIGKCPDPKCCTDIDTTPDVKACNIGSLPSAQFASGKSGLSASSTAILDAAAEQIKANPNCKICVVGYGGSSKREQQLSWDRVNSVINYLNENKGISRDRFVFKYGEAGDANTVDLQDCTGEEGTNNVPPPHPQYRTSK